MRDGDLDDGVMTMSLGSALMWMFSLSACTVARGGCCDTYQTDTGC